MNRARLNRRREKTVFFSFVILLLFIILETLRRFVFHVCVSLCPLVGIKLHLDLIITSFKCDQLPADEETESTPEGNEL